MSLRVVASPALAVSLDDVKEHLNILHSDDDVRLNGLIHAATAQVEAATQRRFVTQTLEWVIDCWPAVLCLPVAPARRDGFSISFASPSGGLEAVPADQYRLVYDGQALTARPKWAWPVLDYEADERIIVRFVAGEDVAPPEAVSAIKLQVEYLADRPDWKLGPSGLPMVVESLALIQSWA